MHLYYSLTSSSSMILIIKENHFSRSTNSELTISHSVLVYEQKRMKSRSRSSTWTVSIKALLQWVTNRGQCTGEMIEWHSDYVCSHINDFESIKKFQNPFEKQNKTTLLELFNWMLIWLCILYCCIIFISLCYCFIASLSSVKTNKKNSLLLGDLHRVY